MSHPLTPQETALRLPTRALVRELEALLQDASVRVPPRLVQALPGGGSLFVMPAHDARIAMTKLITFTPGNAARGLATIQGDVVVFDLVSGQRIAMLDGPTVTARRTAAVSLLAAQHLAPRPDGPLLIVGAGVQGRAHLEAFVEGLGTREVVIASRSDSGASALARYAQSLGIKSRTTTDANTAVDACPLIVTCTPAQAVVLQALPRPDTFIAAVGAFTPGMCELSAAVCRQIAASGSVVVDTTDAVHEAGDLLQAGLEVARFPTLHDVIAKNFRAPTGPVLFKSCGWAGWDLAAARLATA